MRLLWWSRGLFLILTVLLGGCRTEEGGNGFPRKPLKVIVPFGAGGGSDTFVRILQNAIEEKDLLDQPLVVVNVPGAGGTVGSRRVRDAVSDGHTILCLHEGIFTSKYAGRATYGPEAFQPIAATGQSHLVICVREDSPYENLSGVLDAASAEPESVLFGMAEGTPTHFAGRRLEVAREGAKFRFVPSGGGAQRFNDLIGGHIGVTPFSLAEYEKYRSGGIRAIAYLAEKRHPDLAELPTAHEQGVPVTMRHVQYWWAPHGTPTGAVEQLAEVLRQSMETESVRSKFEELRIELFFLTGSELEAHLAEREAEFQDVALVAFEGLPPVGPIAIGIVLLLVVIALIRKEGSELEVRVDWPAVGRVGGVLVAYLLAMQFVGLSFLLATMVAVPFIAAVVGAREWAVRLRVAGIGAALALGCFFVFTKVLVIDLP